MESLADVGLSTVRLFKLLEEVKQPEPAINQLQGWPANLFLAQFDRFELWAVNLGLFVMGHGSLDYRIRDSESMRESIYMMIQNLNRSLNEVLDYVNGNTGQEDEDSDTDSEPESDMDLLLESVRDPIDRLYKLAVWIRNPATRLTSSKARNFKQIDPESNMDLFESYQNYDYDYISSLFLEYDKHKAMQENTVVECKDKNPVSGGGEADDIDHVWEPIRRVLELNKEKISNSAESYLVRRIARANGRRRQQFAYWKRHKDKLRQHASTVVEAPERQLFNAERITSGPIEETKTPLSVTTATQLRLAQAAGKEILEKEDVLKVDVSEYAPSAWNPSKDTVSFPPPPKITTSDNFFECPYCFTICPISLLSEKAWRAHIIRDLRPYVCTYEHCLNSEQLYDTRDDWIQHEISTHERIFRCFEHEEAVFATLEAYEEHVEDYHKDEAVSSNMAISAIRNVNRSCPVCSIVLGSIQKLQSHIALHLERFAMFSLPRHTDNNEQSETESQSNNARLDSGSFSVSASVLDSYPIEKFDDAKEHFFPGRESLDEHTGTYICVFHYAGCTARFDAKNEWKRHVNTMHLGLKYWVCMEGKCADEQQSISEQRAGLESKGNIFSRKDLYTQHIRRMHSDITDQSITHNNMKSVDSRFDVVMKRMQEDALRTRCWLPTWMPCPVQSCDKSFRGINAWDERMEHVAQQHFEKAATGQEPPVEFGGLHDYVLTEWAQRPENNIVKQTEMGWKLCNPLKGDTEYRMATATSDGEDRLKEEEDHNDQENAEAQEQREQIEAEMQIFLHASRLLWEDVNKEVELENEEAQAGSEARDLARRMEVMRLEFETLKDQYAQEAPREEKAQKAQELTNKMRSFDLGYVQGAIKQIQTNRRKRQTLILDRDRRYDGRFEPQDTTEEHSEEGDEEENEEENEEEDEDEDMIPSDSASITYDRPKLHTRPSESAAAQRQRAPAAVPAIPPPILGPSEHDGRGHPAYPAQQQNHVGPNVSYSGASQTNQTTSYGNYSANPFSPNTSSTSGYYGGELRHMYDMMPYGAPPPGYYNGPHGAHASPALPAEEPTSPPLPDPERERFRKELAGSMAEQERAKEAGRQKEIEDKIRKNAEDALAKKMEEVRLQAEAKPDPIQFKDAVGRKFSFPFHLCSTWQGMEELIKQAFMHVDILGPHVQEGHYDLIGPNNEIILPSVWEKVIQPGWAITMTMWPLDKAPPVGRPKLPPGMPPMSQRPDGHGPPFPPTLIPPLGRQRGMPMPPPPPPPGWNGSLPPPPWGPPGGASPNIKIVNAAPPPKREKGPKSKKKNVSMLDFISGKPIARKSPAARNRREMEDITPSPKNVAFELLSPESSLIRARLPMQVQIHPHDTTDSIVTTVKNYYALYSSPTESKGISFEDEHGNTLIARYENFRHNMTVYVRVIEETNNLQRDIHSEMGGDVMAETSNKEGEKAAESERAVRIQLEELVQANAYFRPNMAKGKAKEQEGEGETETGVEEANSTKAKATTAKETGEVDEPNTNTLAEAVATVESADGKEKEEAAEKIGAHLLQGCRLEAERSRKVWLQLQGLFQALPETNRRQLQSLINEIKSTNLILRELADLFQVHQDRVPLVLDPLNIVLPCLSRSLRDIVTHYENRRLTKLNRWRTMFHEMTDEAGGLQLPQRFIVYNHYLTSIRKLLSRSPDFDPSMMEALRQQIMSLREARGIPLPARGVFGERSGDSLRH